MTSKIRMAALLLLATACATGGGAGKGPAERFKQSDEKMPTASAIQEDAERAFYSDVLDHKRRGDIAAQAGNMDQARAEWATAAEGLGNFNDRFGANEYQIPIRYSAAELFMQAQQWDKAAQAAERTAADPHAGPKTKAMAAHLSAQAWLMAANADVKAGKLEPIKLAYVEQRKGEALKPRTPPGAWKRFVDTTDVYLANIDADPEQQKPAAERRLVAPQQLALIAAEVQYAFDNMEEARRRFEVVLQRWPDDADVVEAAAPLYLQTFAFAKDAAGHEAATKRVRDLVTAQMQKPGLDPKAKASYDKVLQDLGRTEAGARFAEAQKLLEAGKPAEAAKAFEALAADPASGDVAGALHNAAIAWDKAGDAAKASALRQRILKDFPDSKVAPQNALLLAAQHSKKGDHAGAARMYSEFVEKWPGDPNRCVALQNVAAELDTAKKTADAAERYLVFGKDPTCAKGDPNFAARALYRAGTLFSFAKSNAKAQEAFAAAVAVQGVTDTVAKSQVEDAKRRLKK
ncbi:tetratricopeptide repeat protein [Anaeromyxobacter sp. Red801]|uniref:tetratricopeptide repeat protein n=1 Tax=Anaeromyxobacter sp. Red801 TaxID=3411632 RepID=UPI003B9E9449